MFWAIEEKSRYIARAVTLAWKEDRDIEEAIKEALREIAKAENGSGLSGV
ncbi:MAG: hypothetical protein HYT20_01530 [Candidatus Nealsonbacteria bacterium]|nr:hypothetical protein [Candidatus Nealsonbacteria bacterium]